MKKIQYYDSGAIAVIDTESDSQAFLTGKIIKEEIATDLLIEKHFGKQNKNIVVKNKK